MSLPAVTALSAAWAPVNRENITEPLLACRYRPTAADLGRLLRAEVTPHSGQGGDLCMARRTQLGIRPHAGAMAASAGPIVSALEHAKRQRLACRAQHTPVCDAAWAAHLAAPAILHRGTVQADHEHSACGSEQESDASEQESEKESQCPESAHGSVGHRPLILEPALHLQQPMSVPDWVPLLGEFEHDSSAPHMATSQSPQSHAQDIEAASPCSQFVPPMPETGDAQEGCEPPEECEPSCSADPASDVQLDCEHVGGNPGPKPAQSSSTRDNSTQLGGCSAEDLQNDGGSADLHSAASEAPDAMPDAGCSCEPAHMHNAPAGAAQRSPDYDAQASLIDLLEVCTNVCEENLALRLALLTLQQAVREPVAASCTVSQSVRCLAFLFAGQAPVNDNTGRMLTLN